MRNATDSEGDGWGPWRLHRDFHKRSAAWEQRTEFGLEKLKHHLRECLWLTSNLNFTLQRDWSAQGLVLPRQDQAQPEIESFLRMFFNIMASLHPENATYHGDLSSLGLTLSMTLVISGPQQIKMLPRISGVSLVCLFNNNNNNNNPFQSCYKSTCFLKVNGWFSDLNG